MFNTSVRIDLEVLDRVKTIYDADSASMAIRRALMDIVTLHDAGIQVDRSQANVIITKVEPHV